MTKLAIVTVNLNSGKKLIETAQSISKLPEIEWILIDGKSHDLDVERLGELARKPDYFVSEIDNGLYDAMNKGIRNAKSAIVYFLNSGDILVNPEALAFAVENTDSQGWSLSPIMTQDDSGFSRLRVLRPYRYFLAKGGLVPLPHQGALFGKHLLERVNGFNLADGLAADQSLMLECWRIKRPVILKDWFTLFYLDGIGSKQKVGAFSNQMHGIRSRNRPVFYSSLSLMFSKFVKVLLIVKIHCRVGKPRRPN